MLRPILIILFFVFIAVLMITRKIQTMLALPVLAVGIALLSGAPLIGVVDEKDVGIFTTVINAGLTSQASAMMSLVLAAWLGQLMTHVGVSKRIVRTAAELGGDKALLVTICLSIATALLSMVLTGLGSTIMVGSIVLPIMLSVGVPAATAACVFLASRGIGLSVSVSSWQQYISLTGVAQEDIRTMAFILCGLTAATVLLFIIVEHSLKCEPRSLEGAPPVSARRAFAIGCFQALALVPGTSRSGSTILGARILGTSRKAATEFSFFAAIPVIFAG